MRHGLFRVVRLLFITTNQALPAAFLSVTLPYQNRWFHVYLPQNGGGGGVSEASIPGLKAVRFLFINPLVV